MQAIKEIHHIKNGILHIRLPESFNNQDVEVIVLPQTVSLPQGSLQNDSSLRGALNKYANPSRIREESLAWQESAKDG